MPKPSPERKSNTSPRNKRPWVRNLKFRTPQRTNHRVEYTENSNRKRKLIDEFCDNSNSKYARSTRSSSSRNNMTDSLEKDESQKDDSEERYRRIDADRRPRERDELNQ